MKQKILAICLFVGIISFAVTNTLVLQDLTERLISEIEEVSVNEFTLDKLLKIDEKFKKTEIYIAMTVSHDDLTNIEDCFAEMEGYLSVGDTNGAEVSKSRLISFLEHLRRLVGFNIDTLI